VYQLGTKWHHNYNVHTKIKPVSTQQARSVSTTRCCGRSIYRDVIQPTTNRTPVNETKTNNVNIRDTSHVIMVTDVQPLSTGARLWLANPGCGCTSYIERQTDTLLTERPLFQDNVSKPAADRSNQSGF